jgi:hypothetical protein
LKRISLSLLVLLLISGASLKVLAQVTPADYQRADSIMKLNDLVYYQINNVNWIDSTSIFWYQVRTREGSVVQLVDAMKMTKKPAFDIEKLVAQLNKQPGIKTTPQSVQLQKLKFDLKANKFHFEFSKAYWTCSFKNYALSKDSVVKPEVPQPYWNEPLDELGNKQVTSPDSLWLHSSKTTMYMSGTRRIKKFTRSVSTVHRAIIIHPISVGLLIPKNWPSIKCVKTKTILSILLNHRRKRNFNLFCTSAIT